MSHVPQNGLKGTVLLMYHNQKSRFQPFCLPRCCTTDHPNLNPPAASLPAAPPFVFPIPHGAAPAATSARAHSCDGLCLFASGAFFLAICFATWMLEASRLMIPFVRDWYLSTFKGLVREKEFNRAAGVAYFLPGSLAAMLAGVSFEFMNAKERRILG